MMESKILERLELLGAPLPTEAIQRTKDSKTHRGYDTDGYGYQFIVNRLNTIFGNEWGFSWEIIHEEKGTSNGGKPYFDITVKMGIWIDKSDNIRSCVGNHLSRTYGDALKGAITNGFKKTAAFWGAGRHAYEGALDDDSDPWPEWIACQNGQTLSSSTTSSVINKSNGKDKHAPTVQNLFTWFNSLDFPKEYIENYKLYCYKKYNIESMTQLTIDNLQEQRKILSDALQNVDYCHKFGEHLSTFTIN